MDDELSELLRAAVESGHWAPFEKRLAPGTGLRSSGEHGRRRTDGATAVLEHLAHPGPGRVAA